LAMSSWTFGCSRSSNSSGPQSIVNTLMSQSVDVISLDMNVTAATMLYGRIAATLTAAISSCSPQSAAYGAPDWWTYSSGEYTSSSHAYLIDARGGGPTEEACSIVAAIV